MLGLSSFSILLLYFSLPFDLNLFHSIFIFDPSFSLSFFFLSFLFLASVFLPICLFSPLPSSFYLSLLSVCLSVFLLPFLEDGSFAN
jgi:hypothetical protein